MHLYIKINIIDRQSIPNMWKSIEVEIGSDVISIDLVCCNLWLTAHALVRSPYNYRSR